MTTTGSTPVCQIPHSPTHTDAPKRLSSSNAHEAALARAAEIGGRLELSRGDGGDLPLGDGGGPWVEGE